jgi:hypothetical protein
MSIRCWENDILVERFGAIDEEDCDTSDTILVFSIDI